MKHSKLAEGIEQSYVHNPQLLPAGIDADSVSSQSTSLQYMGFGLVLEMQQIDVYAVRAEGSTLCRKGVYFVVKWR